MVKGIGRKGKFGRNFEEIKEFDDGLKMGVDEERRVKDVFRVFDFRDWRNVSISVKNGERGKEVKFKFGFEILSLRWYLSIDVL